MPSFSHIPVLVIEDTKPMQALLVHQLKLCGFSSIEAVEDGETALEKLAAFKPDLVFLDYMLPGKDGLETLQELRRRDPGILAVVTTSTAEKDTVLRFIQSGAVNYLVKPISVEKLKQTVEKLLPLLNARHPGA